MIANDQIALRAEQNSGFCCTARVRKWHDSALSVRAERVHSARVLQTLTSPAMAKGSSLLAQFRSDGMSGFKRLTAVENGARKPCGAGISQNVTLAWECINPASICGLRRGPVRQAHGNETAPEGAPTPTEALPSRAQSRHHDRRRCNHKTVERYRGPESPRPRNARASTSGSWFHALFYSLLFDGEGASWLLMR